MKSCANARTCVYRQSLRLPVNLAHLEKITNTPSQTMPYNEIPYPRVTNEWVALDIHCRIIASRLLEKTCCTVRRTNKDGVMSDLGNIGHNIYVLSPPQISREGIPFPDVLSSLLRRHLFPRCRLLISVAICIEQDYLLF